MSQRSDISASIQQNFPDNTTNFITPTRLRSEQGLFEQYSVLNEQTSSMTVLSASFALTASFALNAGGSINTGSFATTGSNTFKGNQTISGSVKITGSLSLTGSISASNENGLTINLGSGNTIPNISANGNALAFGNSITNNTQNNGFAFGDSHTIASPGYNNFIAGGNTNTLNNNRGFAGGGISNTINALDGATVGGTGNTISASHDGAAIIGGNSIVSYEANAVHINKLNMMDQANLKFNFDATANQINLFTTQQNLFGSTLELTSSWNGLTNNPSLIRVLAENSIRFQPGAYLYAATGSSITTGSAGQVLTRSGSDGSVTWATPSGGTVDTGSLATTGSNTFNGTNTFTGSVNIQSASITFLTVDTIVSSSTINNTGSNQLGDTASDTQTLFGTISLKEGNVYMSSGSLGTLWTGSSATQYPNIIFPRVGSLAQSGSAQFTGKNNILMTTGINVPGFSSSFSGNANVIAGGINWSGSAIQPTLNNTYLAGTLVVTGSGGANQVSSNQNNIIGSIVVDLSKATGSNQPGVSATNNLINGSLSISSSISGSTTFNTLSITQNNFAGSGNVIKAAGAGRTTNTTVINNFIGGTANTVSLEGASTAGTGIANALIFGSNLVYSGSSSANNSSSSVFVGQFNETGSLALDSQVRFAVGAGTNTSSRSTPFYVSASGDIVMRLPGQFANSIFKGDIVDINGRWNGSSNTLANNATAIASTQANISQSIGSAVIATQATEIGGFYTNAQVTGSAALADFSGNLGGTSWVALIGNYDSSIRGTQQGLVAATSASFMSSSVNSAIIAGGNVRLNNGNSTVALGRDTAYTGSASYTLYTQNIDASGSVSVTGSATVTGDVKFASGSNKTMGTFVLDGANPGAATISNSLVSATSLIFLTKQTNANSGNGTVSVTSKGTGTFSVTSNHNGDTDTVAYLIINPA